MVLAAAATGLAAPGVFGLAAQGAGTPSSESAATAGQATPPLFASSKPLILTVDVDLPALLKDKGDEKEEHPATVSYLDDAGATVSTPVDLRTRGNFRLKHCKFPPIRFDFPKSMVGGTVFAGQNKLKLVTHCQSNANYEQNLLHEHAAYRIYNLVSDLSLRVRLAHITYRDTSGKEDPITRYAFFIEDVDDLAERAGMVYTDTLNVHPAHTEFKHTGVLDVFEYLIGNTDWSTYARHNIDLLRNSEGVLFAVPFDFDWSGLVDASYARPNPQLSIKTVRERLYRGFCRPPEYVDLALQPFREQRNAIYAVFDSIPDIDPKRLKKTREYIDDFYKTIDNPKDLDREFVKKCRMQ